MTTMRTNHTHTNAAFLFHAVELSFNTLSGQLDATLPEKFALQFAQIFQQPDAKATANIVYAWSTQKPIPRLRGISNVVYIGQTSQTLFKRHARYARIESAHLNWLRYEHIISEFGPIVITYAECSAPLKIEKTMLEEYFRLHLELPPLNSRV